MDEVKAMARAGETVGKVVGTGMRAARHTAMQAGKAGASASKQAISRAESELANHGVSTDELHAAMHEKSQRARKKLEKKTRKSRKQLAKNTKHARKELAQRIDPSPSHRRRWPWLLLVLAALAGAAAVVLSRRPEEIETIDEFDTTDTADTAKREAVNGHVPHASAQVSNSKDTKSTGNS